MTAAEHESFTSSTTFVKAGRHMSRITLKTWIRLDENILFMMQQEKERRRWDQVS